MIQRAPERGPCSATFAGIKCDKLDGHQGGHTGMDGKVRVGWSNHDQHGTSERFVSIPDPPPAPPGKTDPALIGPPTPEAVQNARRAAQELAKVLEGLDDTIAAYEFLRADGYDFDPEPRELPEGPCAECGLERPCPIHDVSTKSTSVERAAALRSAGQRQIEELTRRSRHTAKSVADLLGYLVMARIQIKILPLSDTEKQNLTCGYITGQHPVTGEPQHCPNMADSDPTGKPIVFKLPGGRDLQLCLEHRAIETSCDYCERPAEKDSTTGRINLTGVEGVGMCKLCSGHRRQFTKGVA